MKKASLFFLTLIATTSICLAGCGKDTGAREIDSSDYRVVNDNTETKDTELLTDSTPTSTPNSSDTNSSDTDVDLNQEEDSIPEGNPEDESAARYGSGNFDEYWMGQDEFDLTRYLGDNGFNVYAINGEFSLIKPGETPAAYECHKNEWAIFLGPDTFFIWNDNGTYTHTYTVEYNGNEDRQIDIGGCTTNICYLWTLPAAVKNINNGQDPFIGLDGEYTLFDY